MVYLLPESPTSDGDCMDGALVWDFERIRFDPKPIDVAPLALLTLSSASEPTQSKTGWRNMENASAPPIRRLAFGAECPTGDR
jgi:hypothetical protein